MPRTQNFFTAFHLPRGRVIHIRLRGVGPGAPRRMLNNSGNRIRKQRKQRGGKNMWEYVGIHGTSRHRQPQRGAKRHEKLTHECTLIGHIFTCIGGQTVSVAGQGTRISQIFSNVHFKRSFHILHPYRFTNRVKCHKSGKYFFIFLRSA